jgi:hypothetical protein
MRSMGFGNQEACNNGIRSIEKIGMEVVHGGTCKSRVTINKQNLKCMDLVNEIRNSNDATGYFLIGLQRIHVLPFVNMTFVIELGT